MEINKDDQNQEDILKQIKGLEESIFEFESAGLFEEAKQIKQQIEVFQLQKKKREKNDKHNLQVNESGTNSNIPQKNIDDANKKSLGDQYLYQKEEKSLVGDVVINDTVKEFDLQTGKIIKRIINREKMFVTKGKIIKIQKIGNQNEEKVIYDGYFLNIPGNLNPIIKEDLYEGRGVKGTFEPDPQNWYNSAQAGINDQRDQFNNPYGSKYDLASDKSLLNYSILIGCFYRGEGLPESIAKFCIPALQTKQYKAIDITYDEESFSQRLNNYDEAWVISSNQMVNEYSKSQFLQSIQNHLSQKKGLMIWGDNSPYFLQANFLLNAISMGFSNQSEIKIQLTGCDPGDQILTRSQTLSTQKFIDHELTHGLDNIHEGITISYPASNIGNNLGELLVIGKSSADRPCIMALEGNNQRGRIIIDVGFTKLMECFWKKAAGTERYVQNAAAWLLWLNKKRQL